MSELKDQKPIQKKVNRNKQKYNKKKRNEEQLEQLEDEGCRKSMRDKFQYCTDVLANYFQCLRVFSSEKLQELRRKALEEQLQQQDRKKQNRSESSIQNQKYSQIQNQSTLKSSTKKQKDLFLEDFNQLPVYDYSLNQRLRFTKKYAQSFDKSYSQRAKKFGYSFQQVELQRQRQQLKKQKNFWEELKRFICCRGGNYIQELQEKQNEIQSTYSDVNFTEQGPNISANNQSLEKSQKKSLRSHKDQQQNIFLFQQQNDQKQAPQQITMTKYNKKINKNIKIIGTDGKTEQNSSRKSQNLQKRNSQDGQARKISSKLGVDTQLLIKRKEYEQKNENQYTYNKHNDRTQADNPSQNNFNEYNNEYNNYNHADNQNYNQNNEYNVYNEYNQYNNKYKEENNMNSRTSHRDNNQKYGNNDNLSNQYGDINNRNNYNQNNNDRINHEGYNQNNNSNIYSDYNELNQGYKTRNNNSIRYDGVAKTRGDKKNKISKMIQQMENQNQEQFVENQVVFDGNNLDQNNDRQNNNKNSINNLNINTAINSGRNNNNLDSYNDQGNKSGFDSSRNHNNMNSSRNKNPSSNPHLIIKDNLGPQDEIPDVDLNSNYDRPFFNNQDQSNYGDSLNSSTVGQNAAFNKKRKAKKNMNIKQIGEEAGKEDQVIVFEQNSNTLNLNSDQRNTNYNQVDQYQHNNPSYSHNNNNDNMNQNSNVYTSNNYDNQDNNYNVEQPRYQTQVVKKRKNKRKNLIVEQQNQNQEMVDVQDV